MTRHEAQFAVPTQYVHFDILARPGCVGLDCIILILGRITYLTGLKSDRYNNQMSRRDKTDTSLRPVISTSSY